MRPDLLHAHADLSRRAALGLAGKAALSTALAGAALTGGAAPAAANHRDPRPPRDPWGTDDYTDAMFDAAAIEARGIWQRSRYGAGDQRGTFNEVTPARTTAALRLISGTRPTRTYGLGALLVNGFPAWETTPPRKYEQRLTVFGFTPPAGFVEAGGIFQGGTPFPPNRVSVLEERFVEPYTYQIATQLDNLNHIGVGTVFYNGFRGPDIAEPWGTNKLGNEVMGPIVTRGVLLDVLGHKMHAGELRDLVYLGTPGWSLRDDYRITLEDLKTAARYGGITRIDPGDVVLIRTGWNKVASVDPERYLAKEPGIYLREARWLAARRPALIGSDSWALEVLGNPVVTATFPVHQELLVKEGIRIGEGIETDALAEDRVYEFVYMYSPQNARGATAGSTPPVALAQPRR